MQQQSRQILCGLIAQYGVALAADRARLSGLLRDRAKNTCNAEINLFLAALDDGVATDLLAQAQAVGPSLLVGRWVKRLRADRHFTEEAARWAVESWALALRLVAEAELQPPPPSPSPRVQSPPHACAARVASARRAPPIGAAKKPPCLERRGAAGLGRCGVFWQSQTGRGRTGKAD